MEKLAYGNYILTWERDPRWCVFKDASQNGSVVALYLNPDERVQAFEIKVSCNAYSHLGLTPVDITGLVVPKNHRYSGAPVGAFLRDVKVAERAPGEGLESPVITLSKDVTSAPKHPTYCSCDIQVLMREGCKCGGW